jgi:adenylate kinase family enzyme
MVGGRPLLPRKSPGDRHCLGLVDVPRDDRAVQRVAIVGSGGAGKSTLARALGERTGLPVVHLDEHYWRPGWVATPPDEWRTRQAELCAEDRWIMDGNYSGTVDLRLATADTLVFLDLPRRVTVPAVLQRWARHHGRPVQAPGCPERTSAEFLRWLWAYPSGGRVRMLAAIEEHRRPDLTVETLRSRRQIRRWLADAPGVSGRGRPGRRRGRW